MENFSFIPHKVSGLSKCAGIWWVHRHLPDNLQTSLSSLSGETEYQSIFASERTRWNRKQMSIILFPRNLFYFLCCWNPKCQRCFETKSIIQNTSIAKPFLPRKPNKTLIFFLFLKRVRQRTWTNWIDKYLTDRIINYLSIYPFQYCIEQKHNLSILFRSPFGRMVVLFLEGQVFRWLYGWEAGIPYKLFKIPCISFFYFWDAFSFLVYWVLGDWFGRVMQVSCLTYTIPSSFASFCLGFRGFVAGHDF